MILLKNKNSALHPIGIGPFKYGKIISRHIITSFQHEVYIQQSIRHKRPTQGVCFQSILSIIESRIEITSVKVSTMISMLISNIEALKLEGNL